MTTETEETESTTDKSSKNETDFGKASFGDVEDRTGAMTDYIEEWIEDLADQTEEAIGTEAFQQWLDVVSAFHDYSLNNILLILAQNPDATWVAGYTTWQEEFDRHVEEGESAIWIRAPIIGPQCPECGNTPSYHTNVACDHDEESDPDDWDEGAVGFKSVPVFDVSQTDGESLPEPEFDTHAEGDADGLLPVLRAVAQNRGYEFSVVTPDDWEHGDSRGVCKHTEPPAIEVKDRQNTADLCRTTVHEFAHAELHGGVQAAEKSKREVEAEATAYAVARYLGLDSSNSAFYLASWSDDDPELVRERLERISSTASVLIDSIEAVIDSGENDE